MMQSFFSFCKASGLVKQVTFFVFFFISSSAAFAQWEADGSHLYNTNSGFIGIGTTAPLDKLHVSGGSLLLDNGQYLKVRRTDGFSQQVFGMDSNNDMILNRSAIVHGKEGSTIIAFGGANRKFDIRNGGNQTLLRITNEGNVGIGNPAPAEKLDVSGNIKVQYNGYFAAIPNLGSSGQGGIFQGTGQAYGARGTDPRPTIEAGYGAWVNYNALWNGSNWTQPRGDVPSYLSTSNLHWGWSWKYADAGNTHGGIVNPNEVAYLTNEGKFNIKGELESEGVGHSYFMGKLGIGTSNPGNAQLAVNGRLWATEAILEMTNPWPDYVFEEGYELTSLEATEQHIAAQKHLPGIPSAEEVKASGINLAEMNALLLQKIEELTLHMIELKKENTRQGRSPANTVETNQ